MRSRYPRLIIAGMKGGSGKTLLSLGLIAAWRKKGFKIIPYKKGPDYIDAGWLSSAAKHLCYNLDPFLIGREKILSSFKGHFRDSDCAVIEGNRGLYDGMDAAGTYSTAELAKILKSPVILIMDCTKVTRTAGAMVLGMQKFDRKADIKGVVLNQIAGSRHEKVIREAIERYCHIPVLGAIPKLKKDFLSERHMGLTPFQEHPEVKKAVSYAAEIAGKYLDLNKIWKIAKEAEPLA
ncbi:MAG: AAA family ATPase, partial [Nitrospirota bacterium]